MNNDTRARFGKIAGLFACAKVLVWEAEYFCPNSRRSDKREGKRLMNRARRQLDSILVTEAMDELAEEEEERRCLEQYADDDPFDYYDDRPDIRELADILHERFEYGSDPYPSRDLLSLALDLQYARLAPLERTLVDEVINWCGAFCEASDVWSALARCEADWYAEDRARFEAKQAFYQYELDMERAREFRLTH